MGIESRYEQLIYTKTLQAPKITEPSLTTRRPSVKEKLPTIILRISAIIFAAIGALVCAFAIPGFASGFVENFPDIAFWRYPILFGFYVAAGCFFFALAHFWLLLNGYDRDRVLAVKNLKAIRLGSIVYVIFYYLATMPAAYLVADADDAPGIVLIALALGIIPISFAAIAAILERINGN